MRHRYRALPGSKVQAINNDILRYCYATGASKISGEALNYICEIEHQITGIYHPTDLFEVFHKYVDGHNYVLLTHVKDLEMVA